MTVRKLRSALPLACVAVALALAACGEDEETTAVREPATVPEATPTASPTTTPTPTPTPTAAPEEQEGGAGDEDGIEQTARYVVGVDGSIAPLSNEVTAFLPVRLVFENRTDGPVEVDLGDLADGFTLAPLAVERVRLKGPRPGRHELRIGDGAALLESLAGGAG